LDGLTLTRQGQKSFGESGWIEAESESGFGEKLNSEKRSFWRGDYWDTFMRDVEYAERTVRYIRNNPVKAGLVEDWKAWPWTYVAGVV